MKNKRLISALLAAAMLVATMSPTALAEETAVDAAAELAAAAEEAPAEEVPQEAAPSEQPAEPPEAPATSAEEDAAAQAAALEQAAEIEATADATSEEEISAAAESATTMEEPTVEASEEAVEEAETVSDVVEAETSAAPAEGELIDDPNIPMQYCYVMEDGTIINADAADEATIAAFAVNSDNGEIGEDTYAATKLATPTNLAWDEKSGKATFTGVDTTKFTIKIYRDGTEIYTTTYTHSENKNGKECSYTVRENFTQSGNYVFTIQAISDSSAKIDSDIATSPTFAFVKPTATMSGATNLHWSDDGTFKLCFSGPANRDIPAEVKLFRDGSWVVISYPTMHFDANGAGQTELSSYLNKPGSYTFTVKLKGEDMRAFSDSAESAPSPALSSSAFLYPVTGSDGKTYYLSFKSNKEGVTVYKLDDAFPGTLTIPDTINGKKVTEIDAKTFSTCTTVTKIIFPSTLSTNNYYFTFTGCPSVQYLDYSKLSGKIFSRQPLSSYERVQLNNLPALKGVTFASGLEEISISFSKCPQVDLQSVLKTLATAKTSSLAVEEMDTLSMSSLDFSSVANLYSLKMKNIASLQSFVLSPSTDGIRVAIENCPKLTSSAIVSGVDAAKSVYLNIMNQQYSALDFSAANAIESIYINNCPNLTSVNTNGCAKLTQFTVYTCPKLDALNFKNNKQLEDLLLNKCDKISTLDLSNCKWLENISLSNCGMTGVLDVSNCEWLTTITCVSVPITSINASKNLCVYNLYCSKIPTLTKIDIGANIGLKYAGVDNCGTTIDKTDCKANYYPSIIRRARKFILKNYPGLEPYATALLNKVGTGILDNLWKNRFELEKVCTTYETSAQDSTAGTAAIAAFEGYTGIKVPYCPVKTTKASGALSVSFAKGSLQYVNTSGATVTEDVTASGNVALSPANAGGSDFIYGARPATDVERFTDRLYSVCLGRLPDTAGKADWVNQLTSFRISGTKAAYGFVFSKEFQGNNYSNADFVEHLYEAFMGRASDAGGKAYWIKQLENGKSREEVFYGFANSVEFDKICNDYGIVAKDVETFVTRFYKVCLGRQPDAPGLADWSAKLRNKEKTGRDVAYGFVFSKEFTGKNYSDEDYVEHLYAAFMGRASDAPGKAGWVKELQSGKSREDVFNGFVGSKEFSDICASYDIVRG